MMEYFSIAVAIISGLVIFASALEKFGITGQLKRIENDRRDVQALIDKVSVLSITVERFSTTQELQGRALQAMLKNHLYRSFKENRKIGAWTDDECRVQTSLHTAYNSLEGNGEEELWWLAKLKWVIVSDEDFERLKKQEIKDNTND